MNLSELPADVIFAKLADLLRSERHTQAEFLLHLVEVSRRRLFAKSGHGSLWDFCEGKLGLHKSATYVRVTAVDLVQRYPAAIEYLRDGRVSMSTLAMLKSVVTAENAREWLDRISRKSCRDVEDLTGEVRPRAARKDGIRKLPAEPAADASDDAHALVAGDLFGSKEPRGDADGSGTAGGGPPMIALASPSLPITLLAPSLAASASAFTGAPRAIPNSPPAEPTTPTDDKYRLTLTVGARFKKLLDEASALSSHKIPRRDPGAVLLVALEDLVEKLRKRKGIGRIPRSKRERVATQSPVAGSTSSAGEESTAPVIALLAMEAFVKAGPPSRAPAVRRCVPADVFRKVWERDEGCCAWKMPDGTTCRKTWQLELDHDPPLARGGKSTVDGCRLLCRTHNQQAARDVFGDRFMDRFQRRRPSAIPDVRTHPPTEASPEEK